MSAGMARLRQQLPRAEMRRVGRTRYASRVCSAPTNVCRRRTRSVSAATTSAHQDGPVVQARCAVSNDWRRCISRRGEPGRRSSPRGKGVVEQ